VWDGDAKRTAFGPPRADASVLQVAVARLLGYRWPAELDPDMELAGEQREMVARCAGLQDHVDRDGVVPIPAAKGELPAEGRLRSLLSSAYGPAWSVSVEARLLREAGFAGKSLESWLRDGFSALGNYHMFGYRRLELLCYAYLGDWIARQAYDMKQGATAPRIGSRRPSRCRRGSRPSSRARPPTTFSSAGSLWRSRRTAGNRTSTTECA
jgi:hypothetical protein